MNVSIKRISDVNFKIILDLRVAGLVGSLEILSNKELLLHIFSSTGYVDNFHKEENEVFVEHEADQPDLPTMMFAGGMCAKDCYCSAKVPVLRHKLGLLLVKIVTFYCCSTLTCPQTLFYNTAQCISIVCPCDHVGIPFTM